MFKRLVATLVCFTFSFSNFQFAHAQDFSINQLPVPGTMVGESTPFTPLALKGLVVNPQKPLEFQFIVDTGEQLRVSVNTTKGPRDTATIKDQANQLVKYFLAGLTIPEGDLWVNLSPYEKNRMVPEALGQTDLGRDLLTQDYILKQLTASLIYPEKDLGKDFWSRVYAKAQQQFGTTNVPVNTFNKVWILPDQAQVFEHGAAAYVTKATLKVMLDEDYLALNKQTNKQTNLSLPLNGLSKSIVNNIGSQIVREIVLPEIEKEINTGKNFAPLRQIYQALILAKWYKETIQNGLLDAVYTNKNKIAGVKLNDPAVKEQIYDRYLKAYKKGAFNYIKEDPTSDGQVVPRKYFSGGISKLEPAHVATDGAMSAVTSDGAMAALDISLKVSDAAMGGMSVREFIKTLAGGTVAAAVAYKNVRAQNPAPAPLTFEELDALVKKFTVPYSERWKVFPDPELKAKSFGIETVREYLTPDQFSRALERRGEIHKEITGAEPNEAMTARLHEGQEGWVGNHKLRITHIPSWIYHRAGDDAYIYVEFADHPGVSTQVRAGSINTVPPKITEHDDKAMNGGIDLNQINVKRTGKTVNVQFDPVQLTQLEQEGFEGFTPVITGFQYIKNPFSLLGINTVQPERLAMTT